MSLKPCPKCGFQDCHTKRHSNRYGDVWYGVKCNDCGYENVSKNYDMQVDAIYAWNRRADDGNVL